MGPFLFTGLALFGSSTAIGSIAAAAQRSPADGRVSAVRRLGVVLIAYAAGAGILGVVVGLLAVSMGRVVDASFAPVAAVLAVIGGMAGGAQILRAGKDLDSNVVGTAVAMLGGQVSLGIVVAILADVIQSEPSGVPADAPFVVLGAISAFGSIGLGVNGARSMPLAAAVVDPDDEAAVRRVLSLALSRCLPFGFAAVVAAAIAMVLVIAG